MGNQCRRRRNAHRTDTSLKSFVRIEAMDMSQVWAYRPSQLDSEIHTVR